MCTSAIVTSQDVRCLVGLYLSLYIYTLIVFFAHTQTLHLHQTRQLYRDIHFQMNLVAELLQDFSAGNPFILCWNFRVVEERADHGCLATAEATKAQAPERFGKKEKAARVFHAFLATTCDGLWPQSLSTLDATKLLLQIIWTFVSVRHK